MRFWITKRATSSSYDGRRARRRRDQKSARKKRSNHNWLQKRTNLLNHKSVIHWHAHSIAHGFTSDQLRSVLNWKIFDSRTKKKKWKSAHSSLVPITKMCRCASYMTGSARMRRRIRSIFRVSIWIRALISLLSVRLYRATLVRCKRTLDNSISMCRRICTSQNSAMTEQTKRSSSKKTSPSWHSSPHSTLRKIAGARRCVASNPKRDRHLSSRSIRRAVRIIRESLM